MSPIEMLATFGLLGAILAAALAFGSWRRSTTDFAEVQVYKARLPGWVNGVEKLVMAAVLFSGLILLLRLYAVVTLEAGLRQPSDGAPVVFETAGAFMAWLPLALLLSNLVSWLTPPMRRANLEAMVGTKVSFTSVNAGLIKFALVTTPSGLILMAVAALAPWPH